MENQIVTISFANISQRAAATFGKFLAECPVTPVNGVMVEEMADLHAFFESLYAGLYQNPALFGLPLTDDLSMAEDEANAKDKKQEVKRRLDKPRGMMMAGLDFLRLAGVQGYLEGQTLLLNSYAAAVKGTKVHKTFLAGLENLGLSITVSEDRARLVSTRFPGMLPALQALARSCAANPEGEMGKFQFARCDRREKPQPADLYRGFTGEEYALVMQLHDFFNQKGYKATLEANGLLFWIVKYQGSRKVKATPLFQVHYDDRYARPLRMEIKCASTQRLAPLLPQQSRLLQDDFFGRSFACRGDDCGWCRNNKTLGPTLLELNGESRTLCWYSNPDIREFTADTAELVRQYEQLHAQLA